MTALPESRPAAIDFQTSPDRYRHWKLAIDGPLATLTMDVAEGGGLVPGYELKMNSYDLGVDIELADAVQRLRFEHPSVKVVVLGSGKERTFCAGANIRMLAQSSHAHKVNFCKFTNETRNGIEDASAVSGLKWLCAVSGTAAGGGYELALACDHIMLIDDRSSAVALPETPLLAVLPGTGGITRVTDKRKVRRDLVDVFCTLEEGVRGPKAKQWRLVDEVVPKSAWETRIAERATALAATSSRPDGAQGIVLTPLKRAIETDRVVYASLEADIDRARRIATITLRGPATPAPASGAAAHAEGARFWPLALARDFDDCLLHLRANEPEIGVLVLKSVGDPAGVLAYDGLLEEGSAHGRHWFTHEVRNYLKRVFKRLDLTARTLVALIEPGSCFAGSLTEIVLACDRSVMLAGTRKGCNRPPATLALSALGFGAYPMCNGLTRLETRFLGEPNAVAEARARIGVALGAEAADELGLVTFTYDETDFDDEVRIMLEERAAFSPDALTAMEANIRFAGPETMETKIFGRLTAWQNWVFQRPNAVGEHGALRSYGSGIAPSFDRKRV